VRGRTAVSGLGMAHVTARHAGPAKLSPLDTVPRTRPRPQSAAVPENVHLPTRLAQVNQFGV
jgi:hypothetical protein